MFYAICSFFSGMKCIHENFFGTIVFWNFNLVIYLIQICFSNHWNQSGQIGSYQAQSSQLSPRLSQGSPAPPSYQTGGQPLPQMSPTGPSTPSTPGVQVPSGQQSPAWSTPSPQQRNSLMAQNPLLNAQLSVSWILFILWNSWRKDSWFHMVLLVWGSILFFILLFINSSLSATVVEQALVVLHGIT